jgi:hypothetical protein
VPAIEPVTGELPPTATYTDREWEWLPLPEMSGGLLTIRTRRGRQVCEKVYAVRRQPTNGFLLRDVRSDVTYQCWPEGWLPRCTCPAGKCGQECKHREALAALIGEGTL